MKVMKKYIVTAMAAVLAFGMSAEVQKNMVIVGKDGSKTKFNRENIQEVLFKEIPEYTEANTLLGAVYTTNNGKALYQVDIATGAPDENGDPAGIGDFQISIALTGELSADAAAAAIPEGYYRASATSDLFTFDVQRSGIWIRTGDNAEDVGTLYVFGGSVDVRVENGIYDIRCELETMSGEQLNASYKGAIRFSLGTSELGGFDEDQNITFDGGQCRYYGNWYNPFADDMTLQFYTGKFAPDGTQTEGYWMEVALYAPKDDDPMTADKVADGVYTVEKRGSLDVLSRTYLPFTFMKGYTFEFWGTIYRSGSFLTYTDKSGAGKAANIESGTITVSENGTKYVFDLKTEDGIAVTGTCSGMNFSNKCDNASSEPSRPYSTLTEDWALEFPASAVGVAFAMGDYIVEGMNVFEVRIADPDYVSGDYLTLEVLTNNQELTDGTYTVNNSFADKTALIGCASSTGQPLFSWFGDLDSTDDEGYQTTMAPISGGTFTITTLSDGKKQFTFNFVDDTEASHKLTGSWTGTINYQSGTSQLPKKVKSKALQIEKPVNEPMPSAKKILK